MFYLRSVSSTSFLRITTRETIFIGQISNLPHFYDCQKKRLLFFCKHSVLILLFAMQQRNQQFEQVLEIEKRSIHLLSQMSLSPIVIQYFRSCQYGPVWFVPMIICGSKCRAERQLGLTDILTHPQAGILFPTYSFFLTHQTTLGLEIQRGQIPACSTDPRSLTRPFRYLPRPR